MGSLYTTYLESPDMVFLCVQNTHLTNCQSCSRAWTPPVGEREDISWWPGTHVYLTAASCKPPYHSISLRQAKHHQAQMKGKKEQRFHVEPQITTSTIYNFSEMQSPGPGSKKSCLTTCQARSMYYPYVIIIYRFLDHLINLIISTLA